MSKVTRAVSKAAKRAETLHAQVYGNNDESTDPDAILDDLNKDTKEDGKGDGPVLSVVENNVDPDAIATPAADSPTDTPIEATVVEPVEPQAPQQEYVVLLEKAEHKYSVLQGMHRKLLDENDDLRGKLAAAVEEKPVVVAPSPLASDGLITDTDVEDYGSDLIGMVKRAAQEEFTPQLTKLEAENEALRNQISGVTTTINTRAKDDIYSTLATQVPDWEIINTSDDFIFWLAQQDMFSGQRRHDLLTQAFKDNDSARVINFFSAYLNEDMTVAPSEPAAVTPTAPVQPKVDLMSMAAPGKAQSGGKPNNQTDTRTFTRAEISNHYKLVQLGKFTGTEADKTRIEKAFISAANDGRVR